jgi:hypothetical protein
VSTKQLPKFPDAPESIQTNCQDLLLIKEDEKKMSEVLQIIVTNYGRYYECQIKTDAWIQWYKIQKSIYGDIK